MAQQVKAFGQILQFPDGMSEDDMAEAIRSNEHALNPDYKPPLRDKLNALAKEHLGVDIGNEYGRDTHLQQPEGLSGLAGNVITGAKQTGRMMDATVNAATGDRGRVEAIAKDSVMSAEKNTPVEQKALLGELSQIDREQGVFGQIGDTLKSAANNPMGTSQLVAEQLPNTAVSLGAGFAGFKTGAAAGSLFGPVGAAVGGTLGFVGGMFLGNVLLEAGGKAIEKASDEDGFTPQDRGESLREGAIKAGVITGVDAATFKLGGVLAKKFGSAAITAGARAEAKVLIDAGVDTSSLASINAALKASPELLSTAKAAGERAVMSTLSTGNKAAIIGTGVALETVGEFTGEAAGEYAATGKADYVDATIEALSSATMSVAETAYNFNKVTSGNDLSPEGIRKAANSINDADTKAGIDDIQKATTVDEAIKAANDTVSSKPVTNDDILRTVDPTLTDLEALQNETQKTTDIAGQPQAAEVLDIVLPDNTSVKAQWKIVDADSIKASMKEGVSQPRDRTRASSDVQVKGIAKNPDYRRLSDSPVMDIGAPIIDMDGNIVAGNGRFEGVSNSYDQGTSQKYLDALRQDAVNKGIDPAIIDGMKKPVLIRSLIEPVDTRKIAISSNAGLSLQYSTLEQAKLDSERMKGIENLDVNDLGDIALTPRNLTQLKDSLGTYTENELAAIQDKGGQLSQEGVRRVRNAMLAKAYGTSPVLEKLIESTDTDMRNVLGALTKSASHIIGTKGDTKALLEAVDTYAQLKATGQPVDNFLAQQDAFSEGLNKEAEGILRFIDTNIRSQKKLTDFFKGNFVEVDTTSDDMFSTPQPALQSVEPKSDGATRHPNAKAASKDASWVIKNKATGEILFETFDKAKVDALNTSKYEAVPIYEHLTGLNKDERIAKLEKHLKDNGYNFRVEPASVRDVDDLDSTKKARKELAEKQAKLFKKKVVFVKANGPFKINGVMVPSIADTIFVDIRTDKAFDAIMAHELSHWMEQEKPAVYKELVKSLKTVIINEAEYAKKYGIKGATKADITKEIVGDLMGDNFTKQSFWQKVAEANPKAFKDIAAAIIKWLKGVIVKAKANGMGSEQWVKDATKAQDIIAKAVAQYTESEASPVSAEGKPKFNADKKTVTVDGVERPTTNSEGKPINNPVNFWKWFGDSKVVDDQGRPMVVYHGTNKAFSKVNVKKGAQNLFWFSSDKESILAGKSGASSVNKIMSLYVRIENPANWKQYDRLGISEFSRDRLDGAILPRKSGQFDGFVLDGSQAKSIDNNGDFSTTDMRLKFSRAPKQAGFDFGKINLDYGNIEQRPGTTEKQRDVGVSVYQSLLERAADRAGARVLGLAMAKDFREQSGSSLIGKEVATPDDLATVAQVLRDPRFETFRAFYVKDGKIVHHTGLTSRLPGAVNVISAMEGESQEAATERFFTDMRQQKLDSGADGYYLLHNHPSGRAVPSTADKLITKAIADQVPGFISHIVINSNEYSTINYNGKSNLVQRDLTGGYGTEAMIPHGALQGKVINGPASMAEVGKLLQRPKGFFTLLGLSAQNKVISISEVPLSVLSKDGVRLVGMMRRFARNGGANRLSVVTDADSMMQFRKAVEAGVLLDVVDTDGNSLREKPGIAWPSGELFNNDKPAIRVAQGISTDSNNKPLPKTFFEWFGDSKVVDEQGRPLVVYHGTTADFTEFDRSKGNPESDLGAGFYFTNTEDDVSENYAGMGPDLTNKVERLAEQIANDTDREYDDPEVVKEAKARFVQHEGATLPVYLRLENPVIIGGDNETNFTYEENYNEDLDEFEEPTGTLMDLIDSMSSVESDFSDVDMDAIRSALFDNGEESISASDIIVRIKEASPYVMDNDTGDMVVSEFIRRSFEGAGFDGFIDHTADEKFGSQKKVGQAMVGMGYDTVHYVAFNPNQIKSAIGNTGDYSRTNNDIRFSRAPKLYSKLEQALEAANDKVFSTGPQVKLWLQSNAGKLGIKKDEIYWSGIDNWLDAQGKVSKQQVVKFVRNNGVQVEDTTLSANTPVSFDWEEVESPDSGFTETYEASFKSNDEYESIERMGIAYAPGADGWWAFYRGDTVAEELPHREQAEAAAIEAARPDMSEDESATKSTKHNNDKLTLPGGTDYKELVVTVPTIEPHNADDSAHFGDTGGGRSIGWLRMDTRDGGLFIEELQSQRAMDYRKFSSNISEYINSKFSDIVTSMKADGVLEVNCG